MIAGMARRGLAGLAIALIVGACGASASTSPSTAASQAALPSAAAPSQAASDAPTSPPSVAPSAAASVPALPSFQLPSSAKDLEAILPASMCGASATKLSQTGTEFMSSGSNEDFARLLQAIGKSPSDVAYALSIAGTSGCGAGIFRIKGVDASALESAFVAESQKNGETFTDANVGGKQVKVQVQGASKTYLYFKGDGILFAIAMNDADAAAILQQLP